ncbi:MAG: hybrid sensor histidine kinase/response regulator [Chloroflexi bacterium]|nr:MAG: hybrid sensor histidine kinase/response regulator [Chloroflexota bacterium]
MITRTILYIEDDPSSRRLIERMLQHAGYRVILAERGLDGIDLARLERPDLILTDINLPDLSGYEIATMLRSDERLKNTPIVALTAQGNAAHDMAMAAGVTGFLTKPIDIEVLLKQVKYYLEGGQDEIDSDRLFSAQVQYTREVVARLEARIRELERVNQELLKLDHMKETFIQITAHELRTPLTLVFGYQRLLEDHLTIKTLMEADDSIKTLIRGMGEAITRMQNMIEEILIMSRIITKKIDLSLSPTNLGNVMEGAIEYFQDALKQRKIRIHFDKSIWPRQMQADAELMRIVMINLLSNAIKYTPDDGDIYTLVSVEGENVRFSILDTGIGINPDQHTRIFEQFHTVDDAKLHSTSKTMFMGGGLGLGLAMCKGIIEAHGGKIWVESLGRDVETCPGSQFVVVMPLIAHRSLPKLTEL